MRTWQLQVRDSVKDYTLGEIGKHQICVRAARLRPQMALVNGLCRLFVYYYMADLSLTFDCTFFLSHMNK